MQRYSPRLLVAVSAVLSALLIVLAVIQYRWAGRVAQADVEHTRNHLISASKLFAREFNLQIVQAYVFFQSETAIPAPPPAPLVQIAELPRMAKDVYFLDLTTSPEPRLYNLRRTGEWTLFPTGSPEYKSIAPRMTRPGVNGVINCDSRLLDEVPAIVVPVPRHSQPTLRTAEPMQGCVFASLDEAYLRNQIFPALVERNFGKDAASEYAITVRSRSQPSRIFYGTPPRQPLGRPDIEEPLFAIRMEDMMASHLAGANAAGGTAPRPNARIFVRSFETRTEIHSAPGYVQKGIVNEEAGLWQLDVLPTSGPLESSLNRWRQGNLLLSVAVELMLLAGLAFIIMGARRTQRLAEQKMQFVAGITHELRNPLSAICMLAGNQADGLVTNPDQVRQYGSLIQQQGGRLNEMVEQALQYAGVHSKARLVRKTEVDLRRVIDDALESNRPELERAGFEVEKRIATDLPLVRGDAQALKQAIENLVSNAVKYAGGHRWVRLTAQPDNDGKTVSITVEDRGAGIDPADAAQIFEPFYRGTSAVDAQIPGTGLGLSLVRGTAVLHRGSVTFESAPGEGSAFTLHLPAAVRR